MTAFLQEANSNNATLALELDSAPRQHSELYSELTLQTEYLQRVTLSVDLPYCPAFPTVSHLSDCKFRCSCLSAQSTHTCILSLICHAFVVWQVDSCSGRD